MPKSTSKSTRTPAKKASKNGRGPKLTRRAAPKPQAPAIDVESMGLYWHFVDIVWIVIFTAVYLLEYL